MFKSFDLIGVDNGVFAISVLLLVFGLIVAVYLSAPAEQTTVEQTQIEKLQAQISTIKGQILMIQQAGINPIEKGVK
jgi:uncharacterized membrane protein (DUF106 family)